MDLAIVVNCQASEAIAEEGCIIQYVGGFRS